MSENNELSESDIQLLESVGNDVDKAIVSSAKISPYAPDKTLYYLKSTILFIVLSIS